jgi:HAMP domain-containing protein
MRDVKVVTARRAAVLVVSMTLAACSRSENSTTDSAAGNVGAAAATVDTGMNNAATPVAGGTAQITPTDAKSVEHATEYKLTEQNFRQFVAASDSLVALRRRDPAVRALFDKEVSDAGVNTQVETMNAGRKRLEGNAVIARAIESTGMSAKDYFVASIAVAQAERFMGNPKSAPPTPTLPDNAEFLKKHQGELNALRTLERGAATPVSASAGTNAPPPPATSTPKQ